MTHTFASQEATAQRLIDKYGQDANFTRPSAVDESTYPPTVGPDTSFTVRVVTTNYTDRDKNGANVRDGDIMLLVSTEGGNAPENGDKVTIGGRTYSVVNVDRVAPAGVSLLFKVRARGA